MMTKKEFYAKKADEAFEVAVRTTERARTQAQNEFPHSVALQHAHDVAHEQELILWEWWDDYRHEHV